MSSTTNHYGLIKPGEEEFYDISVPNTNMDIMDTELKAVSDNVAAHLADTAPHITAQERTTWNNKQDALGYTPVNKAGDWMLGALSAKSGDITPFNVNNCGIVFVNDNDSGLFNPLDGKVVLGVNGVPYLDLDAATNQINIREPMYVMDATLHSYKGYIDFMERETGYSAGIRFRDETNTNIVGIAKDLLDKIIIGSGVVSADHTKEIRVEKDGQDIFVRGVKKVWHEDNAGPFYKGFGSPEGEITAPVGSIYQRTDGSAGTALYVKQSGTGNIGWVGK